MFKRISNFITYNQETLLKAPAVTWQIMFVFLPALSIFGYAFFNYENGTITGTLSHLRMAFQVLHLTPIIQSLFFASVASVACLFLAYPAAYVLAFHIPKTLQNLFVFLLIIPSWTNTIIQIYAWFYLLQQDSIILTTIDSLGIWNISHHLLHTTSAIFIGLVYCFLPFMVLPLVVSLSSIRNELVEASHDLGASGFTTFKRIILPLSYPGIIDGLMLTFVPIFGEYAIIEILGGAKTASWGSSVINSYIAEHNLSLGAAVTLVGILSMTSFLGSLILIIRIFHFLHQSLKSVNYARIISIREQERGY